MSDSQMFSYLLRLVSSAAIVLGTVAGFIYAPEEMPEILMLVGLYWAFISLITVVTF